MKQKRRKQEGKERGRKEKRVGGEQKGEEIRGGKKINDPDFFSAVKIEEVGEFL